jgi:hypothetical protein
MKNRTWIYILLTTLILVTLACATATKTEPASGDLILDEDFSGKSNGWNSVSVDEGITDYNNSAYRILVNTKNYFLWSNPDKYTAPNDVRVEVDVNRAAGPAENDMGIICRYVDEKNFYFFIMGTDGYYGIGKMKDGEEALVGMEEMGFDDQTIKLTDEINHLRADCVGSSLTFYVNGKQMAQAQDTDFASGNVGLIAGSYEEVGVDVTYDNFKVYKP